MLEDWRKERKEGSLLNMITPGHNKLDLREEKEQEEQETNNIQVSPTHPSTSGGQAQVTPEDIMDPTVTNTVLWNYLCIGRTEPVIGLSTITEHRWPDNPSLNYFRCHCCSDIIASVRYLCDCHLTSASHRYNYIKKLYPSMVHDWPSGVGPNEYPGELRDLAQQVERDEGCGRLRVTVMSKDHERILTPKTVAESSTELSKSCLTEDAAQTVSKGNSVVTATSHTDGETTTTSHALATNSKLAIGSKTTETNSKPEAPSHAATSSATSTVSNSTGAVSHLTLNPASATLVRYTTATVMPDMSWKWKKSTKQIVTETSETATKTNTTLTTCQTAKAGSKTGHMQTYMMSNGDDATPPMSKSITTISNPTTSMITSKPSTCPAISESQLDLWEAMDAAFVAGAASEAMKVSGKDKTISSATSAISKSTGTMSSSSATPAVSESTTTISKCTPSTTTSEPSTPVCHSATVVSKPTATFSNTTPDVSKPSSSTTASTPSTNAGLSEALWESLWQDFEAAVEASSDSGKAVTTSPEVVGACDTVGSPKNKVASNTSEITWKFSIEHNVTETSVTATKTHTTLTTCQTSKDISKTGHMQTSMMSNGVDATPPMSKSITNISSPITSMIASKPSTCPAIPESQLDLWEAMDTASVTGAASEATRVSGKDKTTRQSSTSRSPEVTANSPLKADDTSKTTDVSVKRNKDLKMILSGLTELSKSTGAKSHLTQTTSSATPPISCSTANSKPTAHVSSAPPATSESTATVSKCSPPTTTSKSSVTFCNSTTVVSKPTATFSNTSPGISKSSESTATISRPSSSTATSKPAFSDALWGRFEAAVKARGASGGISYTRKSLIQLRNCAVAQKNAEFFLYEPRVVLRRLQSPMLPAAEGPSRSQTPPATQKRPSQTPPATWKSSQSQTTHHPSAFSTTTHANHPIASCVLNCQVCGVITNTTLQYFAHTQRLGHQQKMNTIFQTEADELESEPGSFSNILMKGCQYIRKEQRAEPVIGLLYMVTCVCTRASRMPRYLCLVCKCTFSASKFRAHLRDPSHIKHTLMHQNPARLPFAWKLNECDWDSLAWEEEEAQGPEHMVLKIIDLPSRIFCLLNDNYEHACKVLEEYFCKDWQHEVPNMVTLGELQDSHTSPQLGLQFMVHYQTSRGPSGSLCLLCERMLNELEFSSHVFSFEHIKVFLQKAHPGSLDSEAKKTPVWKLLDLAKQAAEIHPTGRIQKVTYHSPIWPPYGNAVKTLKGIKKREARRQLIPVLQTGEKLETPESEANAVNEHTTQPIAVKKRAVPENDSCVHIHDGKCPARNASDTDTSVDMETSKQSSGKQKAKKKRSLREKRSKRIGASVSGESSAQKPRAGHPGKGRAAANTSGQTQRRAKRQQSACDKTRKRSRKRPRKRSKEERDEAGDISGIDQTAGALSDVAEETNTDVDRETLKQSTEEQRTEKGKESCKGDMAEEAGTERGATSKDAKPRVRRDLDAETKSRTARKRQRSEHSRPEAGGKMRRRQSVKATAKSILKADRANKTTDPSHVMSSCPTEDEARTVSNVYIVTDSSHSDSESTTTSDVLATNSEPATNPELAISSQTTATTSKPVAPSGDKTIACATPPMFKSNSKRIAHIPRSMLVLPMFKSTTANSRPIAHIRPITTSPVLKSTATVSKPTTHIPISTPPMSKPTTHIPISTPPMSKPTTHIPILTTPMSKPTTHIPISTPPISKPTTYIPISTPPISKPITYIPISTPSMSKPTTHIPILTTPISKPTTHIPISTPPMSKPTTYIPISTPPISKPTSYIPLSTPPVSKPTPYLSISTPPMLKSSTATYKPIVHNDIPISTPHIYNSTTSTYKPISHNDIPISTPPIFKSTTTTISKPPHIPFSTPPMFNSTTSASKPTTHLPISTPPMFKSSAATYKPIAHSHLPISTTPTFESTANISEPTTPTPHLPISTPPVFTSATAIPKPAAHHPISTPPMSRPAAHLPISTPPVFTSATAIPRPAAHLPISTPPLFKPTTATYKPTAPNHVPVSTPPVLESTANISKPTASTAAPKPTATPTFSESMKTLWKSLDFAAEADSGPMSPEAAATTFSPTDTEPEACGTADAPAVEVSSETSETISKTATNQQVTELSVTVTKTHPASTCKGSPVGTSDSARRSESTTNRPAIGVKFMVSVTHWFRSTLFCTLCKTRPVGYRQHRTDPTHESNYLRIKYPELTSDLSDTELKKIVSDLAKRETGHVPQTVEVGYGEYEELSTARLPKALALLEAILRQQRGSQDSPSAADPQPESLKHQDMSTGLHQPSHHPDGNETNQSRHCLSTGSQSSQRHTLPPDTRPASSDNMRTQPVASRDPRTQPGARRYLGTQPAVAPENARTHPVVPPNAMKQPLFPRLDSRPQPVAPLEARIQPVDPPDARMPPGALWDSRLLPVAPWDTITKPVDPQHPRTQPGDLPEARTQPGDLLEVRTQPGDLPEARNQPVDLPEDRTQLGDLSESRTQPVDLLEARTQPVDLLEARTQPVDLLEARTQPVDLPEDRTQPGDLLESRNQPGDVPEARATPVDVQEARKRLVAPGNASTHPVAPPDARTPHESPWDSSLHGTGAKPAAPQDSRTQPVDLQEVRTQPAAPGNATTKPVDPQDPRTHSVALQDPRTHSVALQDPRTHPVALQDTGVPPGGQTQLRIPQDTRTQPDSTQDSVTQQGSPPGSPERQEAPQELATCQEDPQDCDTRPVAPQCSGASQEAPQDPGGVQPRDPERWESRRIKLEEKHEPLVCPDRRLFSDPGSGHQRPVVQAVCRSNSSGERIASRVSYYLDVKLSEAERKRVVGLESVLECQCGEISRGEKLFPFYMCVCCQETVQLKHICEHVICIDHQRKYMWRNFPHIMNGIGSLEDVSEKQKRKGFEMTINKISTREQFEGKDAQVILIDKNSYHRVQAAEFSEGIHILEDIWRQQTSSCPPADQQPPDLLRSQDSPHTEESSRPIEAGQKSKDKEVTDNRDNVRFTKRLIETIPINLAIVKTEPIPEPLTSLNTHDSNRTEMTKAVKHGLDDVSSNGDGETVKRRRISKSPDGSGTCDGRSGPCSDVSSTAVHCPSPLSQEARVKVESTSTLVSQVPHCEPSQVKRETQLELVLNSLKSIASYNFSLGRAPTRPASAGPTTMSSKPWFKGSSPARPKSQPDLNTTLSGAKQAQELPSSEPITPIDPNEFGLLMSLVRSKQLEKTVSNASPHQPAASTVSPGESVPAAGCYGTPVYSYRQVTQCSYSTHGYSAGNNGISRTPEQHPVSFSQYANGSDLDWRIVPRPHSPQQGMGQGVIPGGTYNGANPYAEAWPDRQRL